MAKNSLENKVLGLFKGFIVFMSVYSLVFTGYVVANSNIDKNIALSPTHLQQSVEGDRYLQSVMYLRTSIPNLHDKSIAIVVLDSKAEQGSMFYQFYKATYWLYPAKIDVTTNLGEINNPQYDSVLIIFPDGMQANKEYIASLVSEPTLYNIEAINSQAILLSRLKGAQ